MAWIGDRVPYEQRQEVLARLLGSTVFGMMAGAWAGGIMAQTIGWRPAFVGLAVFFGFLSAALWRSVVHEHTDVPRSRRPGTVSQAAEVLGSPWARRVLAVSFVEGALVFGGLAFVPSMLHTRFQVPLAEAGAVVALFGLGGLLYSRVAGRLLRRFGAPVVAGVGAICLAVAFCVLAVMTHWLFSVPACLLAGLGFYMLHNTLQTCATQLSETARGTGVSLFVCALFLGQSSGVAGVAWVVGRYSAAAWFAVAAPMLLALGAYFASRLRVVLAMREAAA